MKTKLLLPPSDYKKLSDEELIYRFRHRNDQVAVNYIFDRYGHLVLGIAMIYIKYPLDAKQATEKLFIKLIDEVRCFTIDNFKSWLFNRAHSFFALQAQGIVPVTNNTITATGTSNIEFSDNDLKIEQDRLPELLDIAIYQLDISQRNCIELFYIDKMNYEAIARKTTYTVEKVKNLIQAGKHNLKIKLESLKFVRR